ncbi:Major facilitator superfamily domain-containing protein 7 [Grifola frondosa]|uniref:Major facilitator superfamily domain-containing protein 7 n=1 Tax=Grifola frondosa TaxID=5627 RepID=A0A1C7MD38_GRIFR|nr:Major facilitator superfamily domain-containing protein 7 [Grifola frondosa]
MDAQGPAALSGRSQYGIVELATAVMSIQKDESVEAGFPTEDSYRLYKTRWVGLVALVFLNIVAGMSLVWFGPIANDVAQDFGFSLDEINWFGNIVNVIFLPSCVIVPLIYERFGIRRSCYIGAVLFITSAWIRYAGTAKSLSNGGSYALIMIGQLLAGMSQPIFQVLVPSYSEKWFDLKGRTTATMIMGISNPIGNALGQLISPLVGSPRQSILVMAIIYSAVTPFVFLVGNAPPTPPTYAASRKHPTFASLGRAMLGKETTTNPTYMTMRQRIDFAIIFLVFGILVGIVNAFSILTAQDLEPFGYSDSISGLMGATILLVGLVAAAVTAPLFDRVLTHHLALSCKLLCPIIAVCWLSLIWAIRPNNTGALFAIMAVIGAASLTLLPVTLELAVEITRNADGSSAMLWFSSNLFGIIFVLAEGALRAGPDASPPYNMRRAIIFQGVVVCAAVAFVYLLEGRQCRREQDEQRLAGARGAMVTTPNVTEAQTIDGNVIVELSRNSPRAG